MGTLFLFYLKEYKTIKYILRTILHDDIDYSFLLDTVQRTNNIVFILSQFRRDVVDEECYNEYLKKLKYFTYLNTEKHEKKILDELEALYGSDARMIVGDWFIKTMVFIKHLS